MKKSIYRKPSVDGIPVENEGVMAASVDNIAPGKRYDIGHDLPRGALPAGGASPLLKLTRQLLPLLVLGLATAACNNDNDPAAPPAHNGKTHLTITAGIDGTATRTTYTPGTGTGTDGNTADLMNVVWTSGAFETLYAVSYTNDEPNETPSTLTGTGTGTKSMDFPGDVTTSTGSTLAGKYNYYYGQAGLFGAGVPTFDVPPHISFDLRGQEYDMNAPRANLKGYDIMYTTQATDLDHITLQHACALIRFNLQLNTKGQPIDLITISIDNNALNSQLYLYYHSDGSVEKEASPVYLEVISLTIKNDVASAGDRTLEAYLMMPADETGIDISGRLIKVSAIAADGTVYSRILDMTNDDDEKLMAGACYTFFDDTTTPLAEDKFAGSNIYADPTTKKLTFVQEPYDMSKVMYQGLFFRWGGLQGISPAGDWDATASTGTPVYDKDGLVGYGGDFASVAPAATTWTAGQDLTAAQDICYQLSGGKFRLPEKDELALSYTVSGTTTATSNAEGTAVVRTGSIASNTYLPFSGYRLSNNGNIDGIDKLAKYWTRTVGSSANQGYSFDGGDKYSVNINYPYSIRCIKNSDPAISE